MAQKKEELINKSFFDQESYNEEKQALERLLQPLNEFIQSCEPFGFKFSNVHDLSDFLQDIDSQGEKAIFNRVVEQLERSQQQLAGYPMKRQALIDSVQIPETRPVINAFAQVRSAARDNLKRVNDLELSGKKVVIPEGILQTLEQKYTLEAQTEDEAMLMSALEQCADHVANLNSLYYELNIEGRAGTRRPLLDLVKHGQVDASAFKIVKALRD